MRSVSIYDVNLRWPPITIRDERDPAAIRTKCRSPALSRRIRQWVTCEPSAFMVAIWWISLYVETNAIVRPSWLNAGA